MKIKSLLSCFYWFPCLLSTIIYCAGVHAQEGLPVYFDYLADNYYLIHPAMAGAGQGGRVRLTARKQWFDVERAPALQTFNISGRLSEKSGLGAILFNDRNGYHAQTGMRLTYAHHLRFSKSMEDLEQLSFGLSAGWMQSRLDESEFFSMVPDPLISGTSGTVTYFNADIGISYHIYEFFSHFSVRNLLGKGVDLFSARQFDNMRRYLLSAGYVFGKQQWQYEPSVMLQYAEFTSEFSMDFNIKVYRDMEFGKVWGGLSYRQSLDGAEYDVGSGVKTQYLQLFSPFLGVNVGNFMFGYIYTYQGNSVRFDQGGYHQLSLGYDFMKGSKRYDCNCPAVNY